VLLEALEDNQKTLEPCRMATFGDDVETRDQALFNDAQAYTAASNLKQSILLAKTGTLEPSVGQMRCELFMAHWKPQISVFDNRSSVPHYYLSSRAYEGRYFTIPKRYKLKYVTTSSWQFLKIVKSYLSTLNTNHHLTCYRKGFPEKPYCVGGSDFGVAG
jgi:hypothetical protein